MSSYVLESSLYDDDHLSLKGYAISFSWDYPDDWCLKDVQDAVFHVLDNDNNQRTESQYICNCVQSSGAGVMLLHPNPQSEVIPCELHFTSHPFTHKYCITKVVIVSETKHLELYLDDVYETTSKGCMLTMKKAKKAALYENEFDLSAHKGTPKITVKFKSPNKESMRLQTVVIKVEKCSADPADIAQSAIKSLNPTSVDVSGVRGMLEAMGLSIPSNANKLLTEIE